MRLMDLYDHPTVIGAMLAFADPVETGDYAEIHLAGRPRPR
jgi:hypothetical protein